MKKVLSTLLCYCLLSCTTLANSPARVAIIIDDMGYRYTDKHALSLPGDITYSILPHTTFGKKLAVAANENHHEVLLHIPMEATNGKKLGPGALTIDMDERAIYQSLQKSLEEIPFAIGINNHMGSRLTELYEPMAWTMLFLKQNDLFFLDSKTSPKSQAEQAAKDFGVPVKARHVFLDNQLDSEYIKGQFLELIQLAKKRQIAIAIAHPHPETIENLQQLIPTLAQYNIELVPLSRLYPKNSLAKHSGMVSE